MEISEYIKSVVEILELKGVTAVTFKLELDQNSKVSVGGGNFVTFTVDVEQPEKETE